jgi:hypothetical protein
MLYNLLGQEVKRIPNINGQNNTLTIGTVPTGLYMALLLQNDRVIAKGIGIAE